MTKEHDVKELQRLAVRLFGEPIPNLLLVSKFSAITKDAAQLQERVPIIDGVLKRCVQSAQVIDVSGVGETDANGRTTWRLRDYISPCDQDVGALDHPLSFVATPHSESPVYLTTQPKQGIFGPPTDVSIDVFTWDQSGSPAPAIGFSWRFRVPYFPVVD